MGDRHQSIECERSAIQVQVPEIRGMRHAKPSLDFYGAASVIQANDSVVIADSFSQESMSRGD